MGVFPIARRDPLGFFLDCARRHGSVVAMRLGVHHAYLVSHPDHVKRVLQDNARVYAKGPPAARVHALFGDSLTVADGDHWRQRRRQIQQAFHPGQHAAFVAIVARAGAEMLDRRAPRLSSSQEVRIGPGARSRVHCSNSVGDTLPRELWGRTAL